MEGLHPLQVPLGKCTLCRGFSLLSICGGNDYEHHPTLPALETSAHNGCDLCALFWYCIRTEYNEEGISNVTRSTHQQIIIRENETNRKITPALNNDSAFDEIKVQAGDERFVKSI